MGIGLTHNQRKLLTMPYLPTHLSYHTTCWDKLTQKLFMPLYVWRVVRHTQKELLNLLEKTPGRTVFVKELMIYLENRGLQLGLDIEQSDLETPWLKEVHERTEKLFPGIQFTSTYMAATTHTPNGPLLFNLRFDENEAPYPFSIEVSGNVGVTSYGTRTCRGVCWEEAFSELHQIERTMRTIYEQLGALLGATRQGEEK
jgi:hypothetical protein